MNALGVNVTVIGLIYLAAMIYIGVYFARKMRSVDDFVLAGRGRGLGLPLVVIAASLLATNNDTGNVLGIPELTFGTGFGLLFWVVTFCLVVYLLMLVLGPRMQLSGASTLPDYVYNRYGGSRRVRTLVTVFSMISAAAFVGVCFYGTAVVIEAIFGISWQMSIIPVAAITILYTTLGGITAVALTDVLQWGIIVAGTALMVPVAFLLKGSFSAVVLANQPWAGFASLTPILPMSQVIGFSLAASLWILADPGLSQRFLAAASPRAARGGVLLWILVIYPWWLLMGVLGMYAQAVTPAAPAAQALVVLAIQIFPAFLAAIVSVAVLAAAMSTADSYMNVVSAMFVNDIYKPYVRREAAEGHYLQIARWGTIAMGLIGLALAPLYARGIAVTALSLQMIFISAVVPVVVLGLLWKRINERAAFWSSLFGGVVAIAWLVIGGTEGIGGVQAIYPALGGALLIILALSLGEGKEVTQQ